MKPMHEVTDEEDCIICAGGNGARNTMLMPCGHRFCEQDAKKLHSMRCKCPFCRRAVVGVQQADPKREGEKEHCK